MTTIAARRRATQSLVGTIHWCLHNPSILGYELLWRWAFGIPALYVLLRQALAIYALIPQATLGRLQASAYNPEQASAILAVTVEGLLPALFAIARWLLPTLALCWAITSGVGRWLVLRRIRTLRPQLIPLPLPARSAFDMMLCQAMRIAGMGAAFFVGYLCVHAAAGIAFADAEQPNLVFYCAVVIVSVLSIFAAWACLSWAITLAPLLQARHHATLWMTLRRSIAPGTALAGKLVEINLVLGIVKLASLVLAMVFSAIPLPFESATTPRPLHTWWVIVSVAYLVVNAFFQVVRIVAVLETVAQQEPQQPA